MINRTCNIRGIANSIYGGSTLSPNSILQKHLLGSTGPNTFNGWYLTNPIDYTALLHH